MGIIELILIAIGLSMDAFAVSVCKGLAVSELKPKHYLITGLWFGGFQALMPTIGYFLGSTFEKYITQIDHWVAFILLAVIGINMIKEAFSDNPETVDSSFSTKTMFVMAVATSIDALAVGITFAFMLESYIYLLFAVGAIGLITFLLSMLGIKIGNIFGSRYKAKAELAGGIILILIGLKILLEGVGIVA
ncbi:MAG: manganese efflux pump MntP family protein [Clostridiales bacterium]|nr:manganese efflux pump MntP family protein [Clostridiales bacterium]